MIESRMADLDPYLSFIPLDRPRAGPVHSAEGFFALSRSYLRVADVAANDGPALYVPALSNLGQALELLIKALLLHMGLTEKELRSAPYGHNLKECLQDAQARGLKLRLTPEEEESFVLLSQLYAGKELHYLYEYPKRLPDFLVLRTMVKRVEAEVFEQISKSYFAS